MTMEADLFFRTIRFIEISQEMPELANRSDLSTVPIGLVKHLKKS